MTAPGAPEGTPGGFPPIGTLAVEAAQLLDALAARLAQVQVTVADHGAAQAPDPDAPESAGATAETHPPTPGAGQHCVGWCPVCRSAELLRGDRPEVAGALVDTAIVVVGALRALLPAATTTGPSATRPPAATRRSAADPSTADPWADPSTSGPSAAGSATGHPGGVPRTPPTPGIERIDIR